MKLSIITVNLNNKEGLKKTINSVISQTFSNFEWIVIDGGSTDGSKELLEQYADCFVFWVSEPDKGIYNAMNKGIVVARGEYLLFLNSGDLLVDDLTLDRCFSHDNNADFVYGDVCLLDNNELKEKHFPDSLSLGFFYNQTLCHNSTFIKKSLFADRLYDENYKIVSDWEFFLIQYINNKSFEHIDELVVCYDLSGLSSVNEALMNQERDSVISKVFPDKMIQDYRKMDGMEKLLRQSHVQKVIEFGNKKRIYHKLISACLRFIQLIDKL